MKKIDKIMVALAFAEHSKGLFTFAADLATSLHADLIVVSVINERDVQAVRRVSSMGYDVDGEHYISGVRDERLELLSTYIRDAGFPAEQVKPVVRVGNPIRELLHATLEENVDMIVMGPKGRTDLEHVLVGSVAEKMFRRSPATIVSYRDESQAAALRKKIEGR